MPQNIEPNHLPALNSEMLETLEELLALIHAAKHTAEKPGFFKRVNREIKEKGPLINSVLALLLTAGFGVVSVLSYQEAKTSTILAKIAVDLAKSGNQIARDTFDQGWAAYLIARTSLVMDIIDKCRDQAGFPDTLATTCPSIVPWAGNYSRDVVDIYNPGPWVTTVPTSTVTPTPEPSVPSLNEIYAQARMEGTISTPVALLYVPLAMGALALLVMVITSIRSNRS